MASITSLQSDHKNARRRTDRSSELIKESLQRYGAARSIVIDEDNRILAGNGTIDGAKAAGIKNVRIIETDGDEIIAVKRTGLTEEQKVGLALADNRTADLSEWDQEMLHQLSEEHDLSPWFNQDDLDELLAVTELEPEEGNTDPDDVPEPPEDPTTKLGDLWILGNHRLLCGDSTNPQHVERLMDGKKADMVFTDPPYGIDIGNQSQGKGGGVAKKISYGINEWDKEIPHEAISIALLSSDACVLWGANYYADKLPPSSCWIAWDKDNGETDFADIELAWTSFPKAARLFKWKWAGMLQQDMKNKEKRVHPTQKPVALAEWTFDKFSAGKIVLDLFGGSGSTLIACEKTSRHCRMMELDPAYCDVIVKRWEDFTGNTAVCEPSAAHFDDEAD